MKKISNNCCRCCTWFFDSGKVPTHCPDCGVFFPLQAKYVAEVEKKSNGLSEGLVVLFYFLWWIGWTLYWDQALWLLVAVVPGAVFAGVTTWIHYLFYSNYFRAKFAKTKLLAYGAMGERLNSLKIEQATTVDDIKNLLRLAKSDDERRGELIASGRKSVIEALFEKLRINKALQLEIDTSRHANALKAIAHETGLALKLPNGRPKEERMQTLLTLAEELKNAISKWKTASSRPQANLSIYHPDYQNVEILNEPDPTHPLCLGKLASMWNTRSDRLENGAAGLCRAVRDLIEQTIVGRISPVQLQETRGKAIEKLAEYDLLINPWSLDDLESAYIQTKGEIRVVNDSQ